MINQNLSDIPGDVIRSALCKTIENELKSNKYKVNISSASKVGENNFVGIIYRVACSREDGNYKYKMFKLILKVAPKNLARRSQFTCRMCFLREIYMYNEVKLSE